MFRKSLVLIPAALFAATGLSSVYADTATVNIVNDTACSCSDDGGFQPTNCHIDNSNKRDIQALDKNSHLVGPKIPAGQTGTTPLFNQTPQYKSIAVDVYDKFGPMPTTFGGAQANATYYVATVSPHPGIIMAGIFANKLC